MNSRQHKKQHTRQAFFDAIFDLGMQGHSFSTISLRQVANEIGVVPTTFYRHFENMEDLGQCLVKEEVAPLLLNLRKRYQVKRNQNYEQQIIHRASLFLADVDAHPQRWRFLVSERYGGSQAVRQALDQQIKLFMQMMSEDLSLQASFRRISAYDRRLLAEVVFNLKLSWVFDWLALSHTKQSSETCDDTLTDTKKEKMRDNCTRQALMIMLGAKNWYSDKEMRLDD